MRKFIRDLLMTLVYLCLGLMTLVYLCLGCNKHVTEWRCVCTYFVFNLLVNVCTLIGITLTVYSDITT